MKTANPRVAGHLPRKRFFLRAVSFLTSTAFLLTSVSGNGELWAQGLSIQGSAEVRGLGLTQDTFVVPSDLGTLRDFARPSSEEAPFVFHIQDAHANVDAQKSIQGLLAWLSRQPQGSRMTVYLEGVSGTIHPEYLQLFPDYPEINEAVVQDLASKGELNGVELFAWENLKNGVSEEAFRVEGVEETELYRDNLTTYREVLGRQDEIAALVSPLDKQLELAKSRILSPALRDFLKERDRRKMGHYQNESSSPQLAAYVTYLAGQVKKELQIDLEDRFEQVRFPNLVRLLVLEQLEKSLDRAAADRERAKAVETLMNRAGSEEEKTMIRNFDALDVSMDARRIAESVWAWAAEKRVDLRPYREMWKNAGSIVLRSEVRGEALFAEMDILESWLVEKWIQNDGERKLLGLLRDAELIEKLLALKWTPSDEEAYLARPQEVLQSVFGTELAEMLEKNGEAQAAKRFTVNADALRSAVEDALHFYETARERDAIIMERTLAPGQEGRLKVLVSGGFHTTGLTQLLRAQGAGYAVVQPHIRRNDNGQLYHNALKEKNNDVSVYFDQPVLNKQQALYFKSYMETALPLLWDKYQVPHSEMASKIASAMQVHPVLADAVTAEAKAEGTSSRLEVTPRVSNEPVSFGDQGVALPSVTGAPDYFSRVWTQTTGLLDADAADEPHGFSAVLSPMGTTARISSLRTPKQTPARAGQRSELRGDDQELVRTLAATFNRERLLAAMDILRSFEQGKVNPTDLGGGYDVLDNMGFPVYGYGEGYEIPRARAIVEEALVLKNTPRSELRQEDWVARNTPELVNYTVVSRQFEAGLNRDILEAIEAKYGRAVANFVSQSNFTGGLGALMPDLIDSWKKNGTDIIAIHPLYNDKIKGLVRDLPEEITSGRKKLGDYLREILTDTGGDTGIEFQIKLPIGDDFRNKAQGKARGIVDKEFTVHVYKVNTRFGGTPSYYLDVFYAGANGEQIRVFDEVYPDSDAGSMLWRDVHMGTYALATERLVQILQAQGDVKQNLLFVDNEVFASMPTPLLPKALHHHINHTVFRPGLYRPDESSFEMLGYPEWMRPFIVRDGKINVTDAVALNSDVVTGVGLYEHTPVLGQDGIFSGHLHKLTGYNKDGVRSTNGVLLDQWQAPEKRALIQQYKAKLGLSQDTTDREFFKALDGNSALLSEFQLRSEYINAAYVGLFYSWLAGEQKNPLWLNTAAEEIAKRTGQAIADPVKHVNDFLEAIRAAFADESKWEAVKSFDAARDVFIEDPIVSNVRRQVPYKGPEKWIEVLESLRGNQEAIEDFRKNSARVVIGGRIFDQGAYNTFQRIKDLIQELGLQDRIVTVENYSIQTAPIIFQAMAGVVMLSDEFLEASATSMMKGLANRARLIGVWGGADPELFTIIEKNTGREIDVFGENVTHDQLVENLDNGTWKITNGHLVRYADEMSHQMGGGRRPSAASLAQALKDLRKDYGTPESRRAAQYDAVASSHKVDIETSQARAHAYLWESAIKAHQRDAALLNGLAIPLDAAEKLLKKQAGVGFGWSRRPDLTKKDVVLVEQSQTGLNGFLEGFRSLRMRGREALWSLSYHASNTTNSPQGDVFFYILNVLLPAGEASLQPARLEIERLAKLAAETTDANEKVELNLHAYEVLDQLALQLSRNLLDHYIAGDQGIDLLLQERLVRENLVRYLDINAQPLTSTTSGIKNYAVDLNGQKVIVSINVGAFVLSRDKDQKAWDTVFGTDSFGAVLGIDALKNVSAIYEAQDVVTNTSYRSFSMTELLSKGLPIGVPANSNVQVLRLAQPQEQKLIEYFSAAVKEEFVGGNQIPADLIVEEIKRLRENPAQLREVLEKVARDLKPEEARRKFSDAEGKPVGVPAVMAFIAALSPDLLRYMREWNVDVYNQIDAAISNVNNRDIFDKGDIQFHRPDQKKAIVLSRVLGGRHVVIPVYFGTRPYSQQDGKVWIRVRQNLDVLGVENTGKEYIVRDHLMNQTYPGTLNGADLFRNGWGVGIPVLNDGSHFQMLSISPAGARSELRTAPPASDADIEKGLAYQAGRIKNDPMAEAFRPSRLDDFLVIPELDEETRLHYMSVALKSLARGEGVFSTAAAGAASRMSMQEISKPENHEKYADLLNMAQEVFGGEHEIVSKGAVPIGRDETGKPYTFLGLFLANIARLQSKLADDFKQAKANRVLVMTNSNYQEELDLELARNDRYGLAPDQFIQHDGLTGFQQDLGTKYYAPVKDVKTAYEKRIKVAGSDTALVEQLKAEMAIAVAKAAEIEEQIKTDPKAVIFPDEKDPLGHGEFLHQMVSKGILLDLIGDDFDNPKTKWISFRNIDNSAATYDADWLVSLGIFLEQGIAMQPEVSLRLPGMRGGGLYITEDGNHRLAEDPNIDESLKKMIADLQAQGFTRQPLTTELKQQLRDGLVNSGSLTLEPSFISFEAETITDPAGLEALLQSKDDKISVFVDQAGARHLYRITTSADTKGFNDAVALFTPSYVLDLYRRDDSQTVREIYEEMKAARGNPTALEAIAERGRSRFPSLVDPKPARNNPVLVATKIETNMWQSTSVARTDQKIRAVGVYGIGNIDRAAFDAAEGVEKARIASSVRFLATKQWEGPAESYQSNKPWIDAIIEGVLKESLYPAEAVRSELRDRLLPEVIEGQVPVVSTRETIRAVTPVVDAARGEAYAMSPASRELADAATQSVYATAEALSAQLGISREEALTAILVQLLPSETADSAQWNIVMAAARQELGDALASRFVDNTGDNPYHFQQAVTAAELSRDEDQTMIAFTLLSRKQHRMTFFIPPDDDDDKLISSEQLDQLLAAIKEKIRRLGGNDAAAKRLTLIALPAGDEAQVRKAMIRETQGVNGDLYNIVLDRTRSFLEAFGVVKGLSRVDRGQVGYSEANYLAGALLGQKDYNELGIFDLQNEMRRLGYSEEVVQRISRMIQALQKISAAA